jgi:hypothetical protein
MSEAERSVSRMTTRPVTIEQMQHQLLHSAPSPTVSHLLAQSIDDPDHDIIVGGNRESAAEYFDTTLFDQDLVVLSFSRTGSPTRQLRLAEVMACTDAILGRDALKSLHSIQITSSRVQYYATLIRGPEAEQPTPLQAAFMVRKLDAKPALSRAAIELLPTIP